MHPVRLLGVVARHGGKFTFYLVELRAACTGPTVKRSVRLSLSLSFSLSLGRERATLGRYERGSLLLRRRPVVKPVSMSAEYRMVLNSLYSAEHGLGRDLPCPYGTTGELHSK